MIYPRPSKDCGYCKLGGFCECLCHEKDVINCHHYHVHEETLSGKVKPVKDLEHFRN